MAGIDVREDEVDDDGFNSVTNQRLSRLADLDFV
jgi:hypothetical protein